MASVLMSSSRSSTREILHLQIRARRGAAGGSARDPWSGTGPACPGLSAMVSDGFMTTPAVYIATVTPAESSDRPRFRWHRNAEGHRRRDLRSLRAARVAGDRCCLGAQRDLAARGATAMWALARVERPEALAYAREIGHLRPGLDALMAAAPRAEHAGVAGVGRLRLLHRGAARPTARPPSSVATSTPPASSTAGSRSTFRTPSWLAGAAPCARARCATARAPPAARSCSSATGRAIAAPSGAPIASSPSAARCSSAPAPSGQWPAWRSTI